MRLGGTRLVAAWLGAGVLLWAPASAWAGLKTTTLSTPGEHVFVVPPAVTTLLVSVVGGNGGAGADGVLGGAGATVTASLTVHPGEKLYAEVGGNGHPAVNTATGGLGGFNGGGTGGSQVVLFGGKPSGGGGGGASDVRTIPGCPANNLACGTLASRLVVAAGGGGGGGSSTNEFGGIGGASDANGLAGVNDSLGDTGGTGGLRGTLLGGGPAGTPGTPSPGALGLGGGGSSGIGGGGGGGGGGIYGGGGGGTGNAQLISGGATLLAAGGGGGGGGASSQPPGPKGVSNVSLRPTASGAQPHITFAWKLPRPAVRTLPVTALKPTSATLHATLNPNGAPVATCHFTISPASLIGSVLPCAQQVHVGLLPIPVSAAVAGLKPRTKYTVRLVAANAQGTARGNPVTFTTPRRR